MKQSVIKHTSSGCEIVYEEVGKPSDKYRVELIKKNGKLFAKKIFEEEKI